MAGTKRGGASPAPKDSSAVTGSEEAIGDAVKGVPPALQHFDSLPDSAYVKQAVACALFGGIGGATLWRWARDDPDLMPDKLGPNLTGWKVGKLRRALAKRRTPEAA